MKRTSKEVLLCILETPNDKKPHSYGWLEKEVRTSWKTIRNHCATLELFEVVGFNAGKIRITVRGLKMLEKIK